MAHEFKYGDRVIFMYGIKSLDGETYHDGAVIDTHIGTYEFIRVELPNGKCVLVYECNLMPYTKLGSMINASP